MKTLHTRHALFILCGAFLLTAAMLLTSPASLSAQEKPPVAPAPAAQIVGERKLTPRASPTRLFYDSVRSRLLAACAYQQGFRIVEVPASSVPTSKPVKRKSADSLRDKTLFSMPEKSAPMEGPYLLTCDFSGRSETGRDTLYWTSNTIWGRGGYLHTAGIFPGGAVGDAYEDVGRLIMLAAGKPQGRTYRVYVEPYHDLVFPDIAYVDAYQGSKMVQHWVNGRGFIPRQIVYVPRTDQVWLVYGWELRSLSNQIIPLPGRVPPEKYNLADGLLDVADLMAVTGDGETAYFADAEQKAIHKFRLEDGSLLATRTLPFVPNALVIDDQHSLLHVGDPARARICQIRLF